MVDIATKNTASPANQKGGKKTKLRHQRKPSEHTDIALTRIRTLLSEAAIVAHEDKALADRYASMARKIAMRYKVSMPSTFKRQICKSCGSFMLPGLSCRVRMTDGKVSMTCMSCGDIKRHPYLKEQKKKRQSKASNRKMHTLSG